MDFSVTSRQIEEVRVIKPEYELRAIPGNWHLHSAQDQSQDLKQGQRKYPIDA